VNSILPAIAGLSSHNVTHDPNGSFVKDGQLRKWLPLEKERRTSQKTPTVSLLTYFDVLLTEQKIKMPIDMPVQTACASFRDIPHDLIK